MAFTGQIDWNVGLVGSMCSEFFCATGQDGKHYVNANHGSAPGGVRTTYLGCIETLNPYSHILDEAEFIADANALLGTPPVGAGNWYACESVTIPGTDKLLCLGGCDSANVLAIAKQVIWLWYEIVDESTLTLVGGGRRVCGQAQNGWYQRGAVGDEIGNPGGWPISGVSNVIDSSVFLAMVTGGANVFNPASTSLNNFIVKIPVNTGADVDVTAASWDAHLTLLPYSAGTDPLNGFFSLNDDPGSSTHRFNTQRASIYDYGDSTHIGFLAYIGTYEGIANGNAGATLYHTKVNYVAQTTDGVNDVSSTFGIPWSDLQVDFFGAASGEPVDDYYSPTVIGLDLFFARAYSNSAAKSFGKYRQFTLPGDGDIANVVEGQSLAATFFPDEVSALSATPRGMHLFSEDGVLYAMKNTLDSYVFGVLGDYPAVAVEDECGAEDEADPLGPCDVEWPTCVLVPSRVNVDVFAPSVSPGRSFAGFEQLIQPDAGHWRITFGEIPIRTMAHALEWRRIEGALQGRNGVVCVPVYEGKLSETPIVTTVSSDWGIGETTVDIEQTAGEDIRAGMHFSVDDRLYRINRIDSTDGDVSQVVIWPPLREALADGATANFNTPTCRCRLERDDSMDVDLELLRFARPSVTFVEDV